MNRYFYNEQKRTCTEELKLFDFSEVKKRCVKINNSKINCKFYLMGFSQ